MARFMLLVSRLNINPRFSHSFVARRASLVAPAVLPPVVLKGKHLCGAGTFAFQPVRRSRKRVRNAV
jgi:hypothetical protein